MPQVSIPQVLAKRIRSCVSAPVAEMDLGAASTRECFPPESGLGTANASPL